VFSPVKKASKDLYGSGGDGIPTGEPDTLGIAFLVGVGDTRIGVK